MGERLGYQFKGSGSLLTSSGTTTDLISSGDRAYKFKFHTKALFVGGKYSSSDPTYHNGDLTPVRTNVKGEIITEMSGSTSSYIIPMFDLLAWSGFTNQPANDGVAQAVKVLAEYFGLEVIDARSAMGMNVLTEYIYTVDKVHIAYRGAKRIANTVTNTLLQ